MRLARTEAIPSIDPAWPQVDELGRRTVSTVKSLIFLPMAISMVAASVAPDVHVRLPSGGLW